MIILGITIFIPSCTAEDVSLDIHILGESSQLKSGKQIIVAGIWHQINVTLENRDPLELILKMYKGTEPPSEKNEANYYQWSYNKNYQFPWKDDMTYNGFYYILNNSCKKVGNIYCFTVGIMDTLPNDIDYYEEWTIEVYDNNERIYLESIIIEKQKIGIAKSHGDIVQFYVDPYTVMDSEGSDFFTLKNTGNVPIDIAIDYSSFNELIEFVKYSPRLSPSSYGEYSFILHAESWEPQLITGMGSCSGSIPSNLFVNDSDAMIVLYSTLAIDGPTLRVFVGHSNYELQKIPDTGITFQYKKNINMYEGEVKEIPVFISGKGDVDLNIWCDEVNIKILDILDEQKSVESPFSVTSTPDKEHTVVVAVEAIRENHVGTIYYDLNIKGKTYSYETNINIDPPLLNEDTGFTFGTTSNMTIIVIICVLFVVGYMFYSQVRYRRR